MVRKFLGLAALLAAMAAVPAQAQLAAILLGGAVAGGEKSLTQEGWSFPSGDVKILVFRPDVHVGEQSAGGMNQPNAEWTRSARQALIDALQAEQAGRSNQLVLIGDLEGDQSQLVSDYTGLFKSVSDAVIAHKLIPGNRLPSKREKFDWTLGPGADRLRALGGDYGLFIYTNDSYGSAGRKAMQVMGAMFGAGVSSGVHTGYAGLVDLHTGELVWINADFKMGGDIREAEGAKKRVSQLLEDFPLRSSATASASGPAAK